MLGHVADLLRDVAETVVLPRFATLTESQLERRNPFDLVTDADRDAEAALHQALTRLLPGSLVIGEEAATADRRILAGMKGSEPVWIVDPVDGTGNYAHGRLPFAMMVALIRERRPVLGIIYEPATGTTAAAEHGYGAWLDGQPLPPLAGVTTAAQACGAVLTWHLPDPVRNAIACRLHRIRRPLDGWHCTGREYLELLRGTQDFAIFARTRPWDHAAGTLLVREAGGTARHFNGADYDPAGAGLGLLVSRNPTLDSEIRSALLEPGAAPPPSVVAKRSARR